jgi:hypothetical protein
MQIFLSYASEDRERAEEIQLALVSLGHHVFFDKMSLPAGGDYHSRIQSAVQNSDIFVFLISPNSVAQGSYALTELKYARAKWAHPKEKLLPVLLRATAWDAIPPYLKSVTVLEPEGNTAAEVVAAVVSLSKGKLKGDNATRFSMKMGVAIIGLAGVLGLALILNWTNPFGSRLSPPVTSTSQQNAPALESLQALREATARFGSREYIADGETVPITAYPSLVDVALFPAGKAPTGPSISLAPGVSLDLRFKDAVVGLGIYYKQGLYPSNFNIYFRGGTQKVVAGKGYFPETGFVAEISENPIERVIIQPQAQGNLMITGIYIFAKGRHERVLR